MAVYDRTYRAFAGETTPRWSRFLIVTRYAMRDIFRSRLLVAFLALSAIYPLAATVVIYLRHNAKLLDAFDLRVADIVAIDAGFFELFLTVQCYFGFFLVVFIGPRLVSADLANNALPLYLSRPFDRRDYVLGKFTVLAGLLSALTWVPGLVLFGLQGGLEGWSWAAAHLRAATGLFLGAWSFILLISLLALALSAWVRWRILAGFLLLVLYAAGRPFAAIVEALFHTNWGELFNLARLLAIERAALFGLEPPGGPPLVAVLGALATLLLISLALLHRRIRAYEVVR